MIEFDISFGFGTFVVLVLMVLPIVVPFAIAGYLADRIGRGRPSTPMLLRNGLLHERAEARRRFFHDIGDGY